MCRRTRSKNTWPVAAISMNTPPRSENDSRCEPAFGSIAGRLNDIVPGGPVTDPATLVIHPRIERG